MFSTQQNGMTNSFFFLIWRLSRFGKELFIFSSSFKIHLQQRLVGYTKSGIKTYILPNVEESASFPICVDVHDLLSG